MHLSGDLIKTSPPTLCPQQDPPPVGPQSTELNKKGVQSQVPSEAGRTQDIGLGSQGPQACKEEAGTHRLHEEHIVTKSQPVFPKSTS